MSRYLDVCERVALAADSLAKAELAWEDCLSRGRLLAGVPGTAAAWYLGVDELTAKLWKARENLKLALEEFRAYLA